VILRWLAKKQSPKKELARLLDNFELQTFPVVVTRAMRMLRDPNSTLAAIALELQNDPGVTARVLLLTNSAARGLSRKVSNVDHALALLGRSEVESMLLAFAVARSVGPGTISGFDTTRFWQAAALRAVTARRLARKVDPGSLGETFTASLLQDMAVPVLAHARGKPYVALHAQWRNDGGDLAALEQTERSFARYRQS
jgi:HD-like signal output (HDOD) protein